MFKKQGPGKGGWMEEEILGEQTIFDIRLSQIPKPIWCISIQTKTI